jgi:O-antigen/teichoic acid export membrane protein
MSRLEENNLKKKLLHNGGWLYVFSFLIAPSGYLIKLLIAREVSVEEIGLFYSIFWLITILSAYNDLGLTEALQFFLPKYLLRKEEETARTLIWFTWGMQFVTGILIGWWLYLWSWWLARNYFGSDVAAPLLQIFSLYFLIINLQQVLASIFMATQQVKWWQMIEFMRSWSVLIYATLAIFVVNVFTIWWFTWFWLLGVVCAIIVALIWVTKLFPRVVQFPRRSRRAHLHLKTRLQYWRWVMLGQSASTLYGQINQQIVLVMLGPAAAGIWAYYLSFFVIAGLPTGPLIGYLFPLFNELYEKKDTLKIRQLYSYLAIGVVGYGIVWWFLAYYLSPWVAVVLFGESFRQAGELFRIFAPWLWLSPLLGIIFADLASRGRVKQRVLVMTIGLIVLAWATYRSIQQFGILWTVYGHIIWTIALLLWAWCIYIIHGKKHNE